MDPGIYMLKISDAEIEILIRAMTGLRCLAGNQFQAIDAWVLYKKGLPIPAKV